MAELTQPTPAQIKSARESIGDTQAEAAARVHSPSYRAWQDWEAGRRAMPLAAWELYLIKTHQIDAHDAQKHESEILGFYDRQLAKKLLQLSTQEQAVFLSELLGRRWRNIYERLCMIHPEIS